MEMPSAPHIQQSRHSRHRETVRRALGGTIEFRHFTGFDQLFAPHAHDYPVIGLVREGHRIMECNRTRYRLGPGQLLALNAGDAHGCVQEGATPLVYDSPCSISTIARLLPAPSLKTPRPSPSWETSPASCKSPSSTRRT